MSGFDLFNILDLLETRGEEFVNQMISGFSCAKNPEVSDFLKKRAVDFAKKKISITYLVANQEKRLAAFFTLAHKPLMIQDEGLSQSVRRKLARYSYYDGKTFSLSAFLIAQFARNDLFLHEDLSGNDLMNTVFDVLGNIQRAIGGGVVYLECEDNAKLLRFYEGEQNEFRIFGRRSISPREYYLQLIRFV